MCIVILSSRQTDISGTLQVRVFGSWRQTKTSQNATNLGKLEKFGAFGWECSCKISVLDPIGASGLVDIVRDGKGVQHEAIRVVLVEGDCVDPVATCA